MGKAQTNKHSRYRDYLRAELEGAGLYFALASVERDEQRRQLFRELAQAELRHASRWAERLGVSEESLQPVVTFRARAVGWLARRFGLRSVIPLLLQDEFKDFGKYQADPEAAGLAQEERSHARVLELATRDPALSIRHRERQHLRGGGGSLRAAVLGVNDGLISNLSLTMGVAGGTQNADVVLLAGVAGLLAGSFSMAAGEYVSMRAQRDVYEHQLEIERTEIQEMPEEEEEELVLIYRAQGLAQADAEHMARHVISTPGLALSAMAQRELGLSEETLGSPWRATVSSFLAFSVGAIIPVVPYLAGAGTVAFGLSAGLSAVALSSVGAALAVLSGRSVLRGVARMLLAGGLAAAVTYAVGRGLGVAVS